MELGLNGGGILRSSPVDLKNAASFNNDGLGPLLEVSISACYDRLMRASYLYVIAIWLRGESLHGGYSSTIASVFLKAVEVSLPLDGSKVETFISFVARPLSVPTVIAPGGKIVAMGINHVTSASNTNIGALNNALASAKENTLDRR